MSIHTDEALGKFHHCAFQLHGDFADPGFTIDDLPPQLNIEVLVAAGALWRQDVVTRRLELEEVSIVGFEVEIAPGAADSFVMSRTLSCCLDGREIFKKWSL